MNQFDNEVSSTLKEIAERVETPPYLKDRIDKELLRRCPEYRKKIAVIFGGCSPEYSVSLQSAYAVISHMDTEVYTPVVVSPNRTSHNLLLLENGKVKKLHIDAAFPVLHGRNGEDGTIQGLFEMAGIPVVGCGVLSSALCMDKDRAHKLVHTAGIAVPSSFVLGKSASVATALQQAEKIGYPLFVKPVKAGSSFGITKVSSSNELPAALELAFEYDKRVIVEECISGFEVGCAILGDEDLTVGEVDEIELSGGFFNFTEKYTLKTSAIHVPARIPQNTAEQIKQAAKTIYRTLDCQGFARVDLFLTPSGGIVFNEVNTIPGFTTHSRYPNMMKAAGFTFEQIVSALIEQAVRE